MRQYRATEVGLRHVEASYDMGYHVCEKRTGSEVMKLLTDVLDDRGANYTGIAQFLKRQATAANTAEDDLIAQKTRFHASIEKDMSRSSEDDLDVILQHGIGQPKPELAALLRKSKEQQHEAKKAEQAKQLQDTVSFEERLASMSITRRHPLVPGTLDEKALTYWLDGHTASWEWTGPVLNACLLKLGRQLNKSQMAIVAWLTELVLMRKIPVRRKKGFIGAWSKRLIAQVPSGMGKSRIISGLTQQLVPHFGRIVIAYST